MDYLMLGKVFTNASTGVNKINPLPCFFVPEAFSSDTLTFDVNESFTYILKAQHQASVLCQDAMHVAPLCVDRFRIADGTHALSLKGGKHS